MHTNIHKHHSLAKTEYMNGQIRMNYSKQTNPQNTPVEDQVSIIIKSIMQSCLEETVVLKPGHLSLGSAVRRPTGKSRSFTLPHCQVGRFKNKAPIHNCVKRDERICEIEDRCEQLPPGMKVGSSEKEVPAGRRQAGSDITFCLSLRASQKYRPSSSDKTLLRT